MKKRTKKTLAVSGKVFLRVILATVLCAILYFSMLTIATGLFSDVVGYQIFEVKENDDTELIEEHYYEPGEKPINEADIDDNQTIIALREVAPDTLAVFQVISQIMMLIILAIFPYHILWEFGNRDDTRVRYKGQRPDPIRGYRIGFFASVPYLILWVLLLLTKYGIMPTGYTQVYRLATFAFWPFVNWLTSNGNLQETALWQLLLLLLTVVYLPVVCGISYQMGHQQFSIREHLVFAKKANTEETEA